MSTLFFRYARVTILAIILLVAAGLAAFFTLGRQEDPSLTQRYGNIVTVFPGASAERVEALITDPLEQAILELAEIDELESESRNGVSIIQISMREDLSPGEVDEGWTLVREQVDSVRPTLPSGASQPDVTRFYMGAATLVVGLTWPEGQEPNLAILSRLAEDLQDRLGNLSGTDETRVFGAPEEEIRVLVDPDAAAALGLSVGEVAQLVASADSKTPAGELRNGEVNLSVEIAGEFDSLDRIRSVPVAETPEGDFVRLADIADVEKGVRTPAATASFHNNRQSVIVAAYLQPELRVDAWSARAMEVVNAFAAETHGVDVEALFRQSDYVESRLNGLATNLGYSALIVFVVLFLMMGWRSALIVGSALPLTVLFVLFLINIYDEPLHQMSVTGLVVALGLLIDNAIVVVDEYRLMRGKGLPPLDAINRSLKHLFAPLLASTLTTVFAFAPIALMPGSAGEFISMIGISVIFAVVSSFVLAMTVIPALAGWFDGGVPQHNAPFWQEGISSRRLTAMYRGVLDTIVARPWVGLVAGIILPVAGFFAASTLPMQFFPPTDRDMFQVEMVLPANTSIEETERQTRRATDLILAHDGVIDVVWTLGESGPRTYYNVAGSQSDSPYFATGFVRTESASITRNLLPDLQREVMEAFPQSRFLTLPFEQGPPIPAPIEIQLVGPDLAVLDDLGDEVRRVLSSTPGVTATTASLRMGTPVARLDIDEASARMAGIRLEELANRLRADFDGAPGGSILEGVVELPVRVIAREDRRASVSDLSATTLADRNDPSSLGSPLAALGSVSLQPEVSNISRLDGRRVNTVYGFIEPFTLPAPILDVFLERLDEAGIELPPGYDLLIGGEAESRGDAVGDLFGTAVPLLILMVGSVVLAFNSFRYAGIVLVVGVLSVGLAMFGVWLFGTPLGFNAIVGSMGLVGLSINGTIVVLSALRTSDAVKAGGPDAIQDTVIDATRHIVSTTLTTIGGFAPLLIDGDAFWMPFASAVAGGVAGSALLALFFAPAAFVLLQRIEAKKADFKAKLKSRARSGSLIGAAE